MVTFIYQKQREVKFFESEGNEIPYIESTISDYRIAYDLVMDGVLENSLDDMSRQAKAFHELLGQKRDELAKANNTSSDSDLFTIKQMHELTGYSPDQVRRSCEILKRYECIEIVRGFCNGEAHRYRVLQRSDFIKKQLEKIPTPEKIGEVLAQDKEKGQTSAFWKKWVN